MPTASLIVRPSMSANLDALCDIYSLAVTQRTCTFQRNAPYLTEIARRRVDVSAKGLAWRVAEQGSRVVGYAHANHVRPRPTYRFSVQDSIYLHPSAQGRGVGRVLLFELLGCCKAAGARQVLSLISDSGRSAAGGGT